MDTRVSLRRNVDGSYSYGDRFTVTAYYRTSYRNGTQNDVRDGWRVVRRRADGSLEKTYARDLSRVREYIGGWMAHNPVEG